MISSPFDPMTILIYDGTWYGLLSCIFDVYEYKLKKISVTTKELFQPDAFSKTHEVFTSPANAERVLKGLSKKLSPTGMASIYSCHLSELPEMASVIIRYARLLFSSGISEKAYGNPDVLKIAQVAKKVGRERHRMKAFIRFRLTQDDIYYATIEPDFNVLPLIVSHFKNRYADQKWLIYDTKRSYGVYYDLHTTEEIQLDFAENPEKPTDTNIFAENEEQYQTLWKNYFKHVSIDSRKNTALHLRHVPKRYWKHLTEKQV
ncbi:Domain often clustered or fused with uracil-DNA glycosylase [Arcticibacter svalbardensis MN12-7]|uniref:Domain often clustered or fused with uracil-DNA glycosylase n=1 Tax=Arcticibacter svalbardensis MN12-7 TaxID=1150600 RepID=R9H3D8_9SPHI|nr:TIGR03915 family putative DNA repair protein [Arcticibacter svalbardensis]EOR95674.1 Domain often clustered or fused with uracil-DNA glycosylase [Arcticibacter svalbardensis MN12-7]